MITWIGRGASKKEHNDKNVLCSHCGKTNKTASAKDGKISCVRCGKEFKVPK